MTECPRAAAERYFQDEEFTNCPSDDDLLKKLDAYGHLTFVTGWSDEWNEGSSTTPRGDWLCCFDFLVHECPDRGLVVAYHVVENSDSCSYIQEPERGVILASEVNSILGLVQKWTDVGIDTAVNNEVYWTATEVADANKANIRWRESILSALKEDN